jgi:copper transport protein
MIGTMARRSSTHLRRLGGCCACAVALALSVAPGSAFAHAGLLRSDPAAGAALGASPTAVRLTFTERPQASLSRLRVLDARGNPVRTAPPAGSGLTLAGPVPKLPRGLYTVDWRVVSAVDGHASFGKFVFGVGVTPPKGATVATTTSKPATSKLELLARWILLSGLVLLVGAAVAGVAGFGGSRGTDLLLATGGLLVAAIGLLLLAEAQRRAAHSSLRSLLDTPVGSALIGRGVAIAAAGVALAVARRRRMALAAVALSGAAAIVIHVDEGHAAAGGWPAAVSVTAQTTHFIAAGVWVGGLAALLAGLAGTPPAARLAAVRRFSSVALAALAALVVTGALRAIDELSSVNDLASTGYGRAVLAKIVLVGLIVAAAARNRRRNVERVATDTAPLRRTSRLELGLATVALATAALLGTLSPPVASSSNTPPGLSASGSGHGVRVKLTTASAEPGPNTFTASVNRAGSVSLRFVPIDDPSVRPTVLALKPSGPGRYTGSGGNLEFDGRWRVEVRAGTVVVPIELDVPGPDHFVSVLRAPGEPPEYTMDLGIDGSIRISPSPERAGPSTVTIDTFDQIQSGLALKDFVVTHAAGDGPERRVVALRLGPNRFAVPVTFARGRNTITVVAKARGAGPRLRGVFELNVP